MWGKLYLAVRTLGKAKLVRREPSGSVRVPRFPPGGARIPDYCRSLDAVRMRVVEGIDVPIIPVYLDELWGSIFSHQGGHESGSGPVNGGSRFHSFRSSVREPQDAYQARQAVQDLGAKAVTERSAKMPFVTSEFIRSCKHQKRPLESGRFDGRGTHGRIVAHAFPDSPPPAATRRVWKR